MDQQEVERIAKILEDNKIQWATLNVYIQKRHGCLLIPEEKWQAVTDALHEEVGSDGWKDEWDY